MRSKGLNSYPTPENNTGIVEIPEATVLAQQQLEKMLEPISFVPNPPPPDALTIALLEKVPLLSGFLRNVDGTGVSLSKLAYIQGNQEAARVTSAFRLAAIVIALIDFIRIPLIYLAAWLLGQKLPITLSQNAKWLYSAVVFGLTLASVLAPAALGIFITLITASLALIVSVITLVKHFYDRQQTQKELIQIGERIVQAETDLHNIQQEAKKLADQLSAPEPEAANCIGRLGELQGKLDAKKQEIQQLYDKQFEQTQILEALGWDNVLDKTIGLILAAITVIGVALAIFFPLLGWGIFAASAIAGGLDLAYTLMPILAGLFTLKLANSTEPVPGNSSLETEVALWRLNHPPNEGLEKQPETGGSRNEYSNSGRSDGIKESTSNLTSALLVLSPLYRGQVKSEATLKQDISLSTSSG